MSNEKLYFCGENGITFVLFDELIRRNRINRLLYNIRWKNVEIRRRIDKEKVVCVYLFPSFGRKHGAGEPDVIIVTQNYNIIVEVKKESIEKLKNSFNKQIKRFIKIGSDIEKSSKKKVTKKKGFKWTFGKKTKGKYAQRKLIKDLLGKRKTLYAVITEDNDSSGKLLFKKIDKLCTEKSDYFGFINYRRIKKMEDLSRTTSVINFNLKR